MLQKTAPLSLLALLLIVVPLQAETLFWPGWLGPNRDGRLQGFTPPKSWPESLDKAWQVEVGAGYGTPVSYTHLTLPTKA